MDSALEAEDLHMTFLNRFLQFSENITQHEPVKVTIVGGGATGVELAAELYATVDRLEQYGVHRLHHNSLQVDIIEATERILPVLPEALAKKAQSTLEELGVRIQTNRTVKGVNANKLMIDDQEISADLIVWAAGVKAPKFLADLDLPTNRINQIEVKNNLQVVGHDQIYAIGDCAFLLQDNDCPVPATAQAAHQMAKVCADNIAAQIRGKELNNFTYADHGTLVALSHFQAVGNLLDELLKRNWLVEGKVAHLAYVSLYRRHQIAIHGYGKTLWLILVNLLEKKVKPKLKLY